MSERSLLDQALTVAELNSSLAGATLTRSARQLAHYSVANDYAVISADEAGERIIGAALTKNTRMRLVDRSRRVDFESVLIVAGYVVGPYDVALMASTMRSFGASHVHAALLDDAFVNIAGCDTVTWLSRPRSAVGAA